MLVDPWLVGDLTFGQQSWLYSGKKRHTKDVDWRAIASRCDFILITQVQRLAFIHPRVLLKKGQRTWDFIC